MRFRDRIGRIRRLGAPGAALIAWLMFAATTLAASPSPEVVGGDPRSSGQGPGLVGDPAFALLAVIAIGLASLIATLVYVRLTANRSR
jgi:hypothetical protein